MGQVLFQDKITTLSESSGTISLASGARLTIGGQQYVTNSVLNVSADLSLLNTRYQIYAVVSSGVVSLIVSQNENSVGPAGYSIWKLIGSYYTNGLSPIGFGTFINIEGEPQAGFIPFDLRLFSADNTTEINYLANADSAFSYWGRKGPHFTFWSRFDMQSPNNTVEAVDAVNPYIVRTPDNIIMENGPTNIGGSGDFSEAPLGQWICNTGRTQGWLRARGSNNLSVYADSVNLGDDGFWHAGFRSITTSNLRIGMSMPFGSVKISGWESTPIKDL